MIDISFSKHTYIGNQKKTNNDRHADSNNKGDID